MNKSNKLLFSKESMLNQEIHFWHALFKEALTITISLFVEVNQFIVFLLIPLFCVTFKPFVEFL